MNRQPGVLTGSVQQAMRKCRVCAPYLAASL